MLDVPYDAASARNGSAWPAPDILFACMLGKGVEKSQPYQMGAYTKALSVVEAGSASGRAIAGRASAVGRTPIVNTTDLLERFADSLRG